MKYQQRSDVVQMSIDQEAVLMHPDDGKLLVLNESATFLWQQLQHELTFDGILRQFTAVYQTPPTHHKREIAAFIDALTEKGLLNVLES